MKIFLNDMLAGLLFLAVYTITQDVAAAIVVSAAAALAVIAWRLAHREPVSSFQWLGLGLVVVLGGTSLITRDPRFVMVKPSILTAVLGVAMLQPGWMARYIPPARATYIPSEAIRVAGYIYAATMFLMAGANLAVATLAGPAVWAAYNAVAPTVVFSTLGCGMWLTFRGLVMS